ncbi:hypothetical protein CUMW_071220 [Citrus unshiu]|nr:hypothetical protein CUMW_071220 [Citrus unshiu]
MTAYLFVKCIKRFPTAGTHVTDWIGAAYVLTILGAFLADAYLGRFRTLVVFSCIYSVGMVLLTVSGSLDSLRPPACKERPCVEANGGQNGFLLCALGLIALGTGDIKPCVSSFGPDQYDEADEKEAIQKYVFFNWFFFAINMGAIFGITVLVYIQEQKGWSVGFGIPTAFTICSIIIVAAGFPYYRYQKPIGSPLTRFVQVIVSSVRNHLEGVEVEHEDDLYEVTTKESDIFGAPVITDPETVRKDRWRLCTLTQVEELKSFIRILPIWASTLDLAISFAQLSTFFLSQAAVMDRNLGSNFTIPTGCVPIFSAINALILVPIYEKVIVPILRKLTGQTRGLTSLQRMGVGLFVSILALALSALVERMRRQDHPKPVSMSVFWLFPQFFLMGSAEVFTYVGQLEFFYNEATDGTRSISTAIFLSEIGLGSCLSNALVKIIERATGGQEEGFDYFYWILAGINGLNFFVYFWVAWRYKGRRFTILSGHCSIREKIFHGMRISLENFKDSKSI